MKLYFNMGSICKSEIDFGSANSSKTEEELIKSVNENIENFIIRFGMQVTLEVLEIQSKDVKCISKKEYDSLDFDD